MESSGSKCHFALLTVFPVDAVLTQNESCTGEFSLKLIRFAPLVNYLSCRCNFSAECEFYWRVQVETESFRCAY